MAPGFFAWVGRPGVATADRIVPRFAHHLLVPPHLAASLPRVSFFPNLKRKPRTSPFDAESVAGGNWGRRFEAGGFCRLKTKPDS